MTDPKITVTFKESGIDIQFEHSDKVNNRMFERMITLARRALRADRMKMVYEMRKREDAQRKADEALKEAQQKAEEEKAKMKGVSVKERISALGAT